MLPLLASLNTLKVKDKKDRGTVTIKVEFGTSMEICLVNYFFFLYFILFYKGSII